MRRIGIVVNLSLALWFWQAAQHATAAEQVRLVEDGQPRAVIWLAQDASEQLGAAAQTLSDYVARSTGASLHVSKDSNLNELRDAMVFRVVTDPGLPDLDGDGFIIDVQPDGIWIKGSTDWGVEFGVYEFLERFVGVRWLLPGPDGDDVPERKTLDIPVGVLREEPAFFSRQMSGYRGEEQSLWARRNRMHGRVEFHHNLRNLFPPEKYTKSHPDFFPVRKEGEKRYLPPDNSWYDWQPCFSNPETVDEAIKNITAYFKANPDEVSYSLGMNDSNAFCRCPNCLAATGDRTNFVGMRDVSELYYAWCNRVIEGVLKEYPDKYFGCLAYWNTAEPPHKVEVHPRLIAYITYDRMQYAYHPVREREVGVTMAWAKASPTIGWYDYIYGTPYMVPRVWFHTMADYYRFARANGVHALYAEAYPDWGEGPKLYVAFKLQWNPDRDVDALLEEWYERAVGKNAAPHLAAHYAHWEDFWTRRVHAASWFPKKGTTFLHFSDPTYLDAVTPEDIRKSRAWLEAAVAAADPGKRWARAELLLRAFEYYEASYIAFSGDARAAAMPLATESDALRLLDFSTRVLEMAEKRRLIRDDRVLRHPGGLRYPALKGEKWGAKSMQRLAGWIEKSPLLRARVEETATNADSQNVRAAARNLLATDSEEDETGM